MPEALRNRKHLANGNSKPNHANSNGNCTSNGSYSASNDALLKKKLLLSVEDQVANQRLDMNNNKGETFADSYTMGSNTKQVNEEDPIIFNADNSSINQSAKDQFAVALLRLQADLDATSHRLTEMESKVDKIRNATAQSTQPKQVYAGKVVRKSLFSRDNIASLIYLGWPVVVFLAMRAIEKRRAGNNK